MADCKRCMKRLYILMSLLCALPLLAQRPARDFAVEASAQVQVSPPRITLTWPAVSANSYTIYRKGLTAANWSQVGSLGGNATSFEDNNVSVGVGYEYKIVRTGAVTAHGFIYAGINVAPVEQRGKVLLVVDSSHASALAGELEQMKRNLIGDGWIVQRLDVARDGSPVTIKNQIKAAYDADRANMRAVYLFGRIPVPYSGDIMPDQHENHKGAWPADVYYGEMDMTWTDNQVTSTTAERPINWNVPGDGKFDQGYLTSDADLEVGRVDMWNLTAFANHAPSRSERDLLRQYLNKNHNFRHRVWTLPRRGLVYDSFGSDKGFDPVANSAWRNYAPMFGAGTSTEVGSGQYIPTLKDQGYLWAYSAGGGQYFTMNGIGDVNVFATNDIKTVFTLHMGSYFGDWNNEHNWLRSVLGSSTYTLTASYAGYPHNFYHHMALGETTGFGIRRSQNNASHLYGVTNQGTREVHIALMGDPTLRMHPVIPPSNLQVGSTATGASVNWGGSSDTDLQGYYVYRSPSPDGPFTRVSNSAVSGTSFQDTPPVAGTYTYMVRALKLERSPSGTYFNLSQGIFATATVNGGPSETVPTAPSGLTALALSTTAIDLGWNDNSSNETGFRIQRSSSTGSTEIQVGANTTTYRDNNLTPNTSYTYRVLAYNGIGSSALSSAASATTQAPPPDQATVTFVTTDTTAQGNWVGPFGSEGYIVVNATSQIPSYGTITPSGHSDFTWAASTNAVRALKKSPTNSDRIAAAWFGNQFNVSIDFTDTNTHRVAIYVLDWERSGREQRFEIVDAVSGNVLDQRTVGDFGNGKYLVWNIKGRVNIRVTKTSGINAVIMGIFFGPPQIIIPENITLQQPTYQASTGLSLSANGETGLRYILEYSEDFETWRGLATNTLSGATWNYTDGGARSSNQRFYRLRIER